MKVRAQISMVLNLDKCIGCHTCSVTCKNVWTSRPGMEYAWFNNVETKPGIGYPKEMGEPGEMEGRLGSQGTTAASSRAGLGSGGSSAKIFANPNLPQIDDYYEPFTFDYAHLQSAPESKATPTARPRSLITGPAMEKIEWGPNWEEILGGEFSKRSKGQQLRGHPEGHLRPVREHLHDVPAAAGEHCLNPACVASCPSGSIYKRDEDGIVFIDQDKCRGWRMCVSGCPYKKIYYNWSVRQGRERTFCYPRIEAGQPHGLFRDLRGPYPLPRRRCCSTPTASRSAASVEHDQRPLSCAAAASSSIRTMRPMIAQARIDGIPEAWMAAARRPRRSTRWPSNGPR